MTNNSNKRPIILIMQINLQLFQLASRRLCPTGVKFHYITIILLLCTLYGIYSVLWQGHPSLPLFFPWILCHKIIANKDNKIPVDMSTRAVNQIWCSCTIDVCRAYTPKWISLYLTFCWVFSIEAAIHQVLQTLRETPSLSPSRNFCE